MVLLGPFWLRFKVWSLTLEVPGNLRWQHWGSGQNSPVDLLPDIVYGCVVPRPAFLTLLEIPRGGYYSLICSLLPKLTTVDLIV